MDELLEILDRVDVVMRRRGDEPDTWGRMASLRNPRVDLRSGELATLPGLGSLGHLDLDVIGIDKVLARHAESSGGHLLDGRSTLRIVETLGILATLTGVRLAADPVHGNGQGLVGLHGD